MSTPTWQRCYEQAVLETDRGKLPERIQNAEVAIASRLNELDTSFDGAGERMLIEDARRGLAMLRQEQEMESERNQAAAN
jgi:hypothetical protein